MRRGRSQFGNKYLATYPPESVVIAFFAEHSTPLLSITIISTSDDRAESRAFPVRRS
jgi:hypothetical protein